MKLSITMLSLALMAGTTAVYAADEKPPVKESPKDKGGKKGVEEKGGKSGKDIAAKKSKDPVVTEKKGDPAHKGGKDIQQK